MDASNSFMMTFFLAFLLMIHGIHSIRDGMETSSNEFNFFVSIRFLNQHSCTGAILDENHILTAGHCVYTFRYFQLSVAAGIDDSKNEWSQLQQVEYIHIHPDFKQFINPSSSQSIYWEHDIAILKLEHGLMWESTIAPAPFISEDYGWNPCNLCQLVGWVTATENKLEVVSLMWTHGMIMPNEHCHSWNMYLSEHEKCVGDPLRVSVFENGDIGAPYLCADRMVGIVVRSRSKRESPLIILPLRPYTDFIINFIHGEEVNVPAREFQYFVSIWHLGFYRCGGSIITDTHILTVAHCMDGIRRTDLRVVAGRATWMEKDPTIQWLLVDRLKIHPGYTEDFDYYIGRLESMKHDIAVLTLQIPLVWSASISPIPLGNDLPTEKLCHVYHWFRTNNTQTGMVMKSVWSSVTLLNAELCRKVGVNLHSNQYCFKTFHSLPTLSPGDSGSPVLCDGVAVGILTGFSMIRTPFWGSSYPIIVTSISSYSKFIKNFAPSAFI